MTAEQVERYNSGRKKHFRRCANEISKSYTCPYPDCEKLYGSEGSLNLHMKLKHNAGSKTEREKLAKSLVWALQTGSDLQGAAPVNINLPPGTIEKAAKSLGLKIEDSGIKKGRGNTKERRSDQDSFELERTLTENQNVVNARK